MKGIDYGTDLYKSGRLLYPRPHPGDDAEYEIGVYGRMRQRFLEGHHHGTYISLLLTGNLWKHLAEIDAACYGRMDLIIPVMAKQEGITEDLKASNQMEWVGRMNNIRNRAEEVFLHELVYT